MSAQWNRELRLLEGLINTEEIRIRGWPELTVRASKRWVFRLGHHRLMEKAAHRIADLLNDGDARAIVFASFGRARLNFGLGDMQVIRPTKLD